MATPQQIRAAKIQFAQWLAKKEPFLFRVAEKAAEIRKSKQAQEMGFIDIGSIDWGDIAKNVTETVQKVAPAVIQYKAQSAALKANLKRAEQGQPPIDYAQYTPAVRIQPEISPETEQVITRVAEKAVTSTGDQIKQMLPFLVGGTALAYLLVKLTGRRR